MRADHTGRLDVTAKNVSLNDAVYLGICSLATQTVFLRFVLSSQVGGEFYAALALGGWILWVGFGSFIGPKLDKSIRRWIWLGSAIVKLPIALIIFVYPSFFTGIIDPLRFLPLALLGMILPGILYGSMFAVLIDPQSKASAIYRNEAIGCVGGGLLAVVWILAGGGDFGLLIFISILEFSRFINYRRVQLAVAICGILAGILLGPRLDISATAKRWSGFSAERVSVGLSGRWELLSREDQNTIVHNGHQIATIPDRVFSEEALLWPFLYKPDAKNILLIGYEGISSDSILPSGVIPFSLYGDRAFVNLGFGQLSNFEISDPMRYSPVNKYDIVSILLQGPGNLSDYRRETVLFFRHCRDFLSRNGILFVSAPSDENYLSPTLADYLTSLMNTLKSQFDSVAVIPGSRAGFVCFQNKSIVNFGLDPVEALSMLGIDSPYFNPPLVLNRLSPLRISNFLAALANHWEINNIGKPKSVIRYMRWQGSIFGRSGEFFNLYRYPYLFIPIAMLFIFPIIIKAAKSAPYSAVFGTASFGFAGMSFEIAILYLFSILFGSLYLNIGLLLALFMAGLAAGAGVAHKLKPHVLALSVLVVAAVLIFPTYISDSFLGLKVAYVLIYIISVAAGFATGGGYALFANQFSGESDIGATLYGADLYGAMLAAIMAPGILMLSGITTLAALIGAVGLIITATLFGKMK